MSIKSEKVHDGLFAANRITVDAGDASEEAANALRQMLDAASPKNRISAIQKFLSGLPNDNPAINVRVENINTIITNLSFTFPNMLLDLHGLEELHTAEMWCREIAVLMSVVPLAKTGQKIVRGGDKGRMAASGSEAQKSALRSKWQGWVDEEAKRHPAWSYANIKRQVLKVHEGEVSEHQLKRYTKNPRKK